MKSQRRIADASGTRLLRPQREQRDAVTTPRGGNSSRASLAGLVQCATCVACLLLLANSAAYAQTPILTQRYDTARDGVNASETILTPGNVNTTLFGKLFSLPVDGRVFAHPLYVPGEPITGQGTHNVLLVATENDTVYAYDADAVQLQPLWTLNLASNSCAANTLCRPVPDDSNNLGVNNDIFPQIGITGTPVVDPSTKTLYIVAKTEEISGTTTNYLYRLHAIDIATGSEQPNSPVVIQGQVPGTGAPQNGGYLQFSALYSMQRPGLALANGNVYIAFGSWGDDSVWHGWIFGYDESSLAQTAVFSDTPNGGEGEGGIWMDGEGPAVDAGGYLFLSTGNGAFDGAANYSDTFLKMNTPALTVADYFTPYNQQALDSADLDIASGGLVLLPDSAGTTQHPHILIGCGKNGTIYVIDRDDMGTYNSANDSQIIQELQNVIGGNPTGENPNDENCYASPSYWQGNVYWGGVGDALKAFGFTNGLMSSSAVSRSSEVYGFPGASPVVSANGSSDGIIWAVENNGTPKQDGSGAAAVLHAYDATNLATELYNSGQVAADAAGQPVKFTVPVVTNGKVYFGTQSSVAVYGLLSSMPQTAAPALSLAGGTYAGPVPVVLTDSTPGAVIYYTTDGSTPNAGSSLYTEPVVLTASSTLTAIAQAPGFRSSPMAVGNYTITGTLAPASFVQVNDAVPKAAQAAVSAAYSKAQTAGDLNLVIVGWDGETATIPSGGVTDSAGNVYTQAGPTVFSGISSQAIFYAKGIAAAGAGANTVTVSFSSAALAVDLRILEYSGLDPNIPLDAVAGTTGDDTMSSVVLTTANSDDVIVGANLVQTLTAGAGGGFTSRIITSPNGDVVEDESATTAGSYTVNAPLTSESVWTMQAVALRVAGSSSGGPTVTAVSPNSGPAAGGTTVTVTGSNFASGDTVMFGSAAATAVTVVNSTTITATSPAGNPGSVTVTVTNANSQSGGLASGFTYIGTPTVTYVSPNSGSTAGGTAVTITGTNFAPGATATSGSAAATNVRVVNSTTITATTPANSPGPVTVTVTNTGALSGSLPNGYTYVVTPTVTGVSPNSGPPAGGTAVTITGSNFVSGAAVMFGSMAATGVNVVGSTTITATTPANSSGSVTVTVTNSGGGSGSLSAGFTYTGTVPIAFAQVAAATPQSPTSSVAVAYPAAQTAGDLNIVVVGWNDTAATVQSVKDSAGNSYSLAIGPTTGTGLRQSIYYAGGILGGSNTVTVAFSQAATAPDIRILEYRGVTKLDVTAGASGNSASPSSGAATTTAANELIFGADIVATLTRAAGSGFTSRIITSPDGDIAEDKIVSAAGSNSATASLSSSGPWIMQMAAFSSISGPVPTVTGVSPNSSSTAGGTSVTITGTNFASGATVMFGSAAATGVTVVNNTTITATTPTGAAGQVTVTVTNTGGGSGSLNNAFTYIGTPTVTGVSPNSGSTAGGTSVTITGTNFASGATVMFGSTAASGVTVVSGTSISAVTPAGSPGSVTVTVANTSNISGSLANAFTYIGTPTVTGVSPNSGSTAGGTAVTITGTNFVTGAVVTFGSVAATSVTIVNSTTITATTPAGAAGQVAVTVTNPGNLAGGLTNGYTYVVTPKVSGVSPNNGAVAGGTAVTITGTNFTTGATVMFGSADATGVTVVNGTTITATTPAGSSGPVAVIVTNPGGLTGSLANGFTYIGTPTVTSVTPNSGSTGGGTPVTIVGTNFAAGATVIFGGASATGVTVVSSTTITATTPAGAAGSATVAVTNTGGISGDLTNGFTYVALPTVTGVAPNSGPAAGGTAVTITGTNFANGATVMFGSTAATAVTVVNGSTITAATPAGTPGAVSVTVTNAGGGSGSLASAFTYIGTPTLTGIAPNSGSTAGGTSVTITGTNFAAGATVAFGGTAATGVTLVSSTSIKATTPAGTAGSVTVTVTNPGGISGSLTNGFTYTASVAIGFSQVAAATPQSPTITVSVSYPAAQTVGDLNIVVVGWNDTNATVQSIRDNAGNSYSLAIGPTSGTALRQSIYYASSIAGGSNTVTVTFSQAATAPDIRVLEYRGVSKLDVTAGASGKNTSASSGAAITTAANELIFGADIVATLTKAAGSGFTSRIITSPDGDNAEDKIVTTAGSYTATATLTNSGPWVMQMVTFK